MKKKTEKMGFNSAYYLHMALFVLLDAAFINLSAFLALLIRHEFSYALLAREIYLEAIKVTAIRTHILC